MIKSGAVGGRLVLKAAATAVLGLMLGGCYYGDVNSSSQAYGYGEDCYARYGDSYWDYEPSYYDDGYGYDCYDRDDYRGGFIQIGYYGGWYNDYYYPGHGFYIFDRYGRRHSMGRDYLNYWGGRRAYWKHHGDRDWRRDGRHGEGRRGDGRHGDGRTGGDWSADGGRRDAPRTGSGRGPTAGADNPASDGRGGWGGPGIRRSRPDSWGAGRGPGAIDGRTPPRGERPAPPPTSTPVAPGIQEMPIPAPMPQGSRPGWGRDRDMPRGDAPGGVAAAPRGDGGGRRDRGGWTGDAPRAAPPVDRTPPAYGGGGSGMAPPPRAARGPEPRMAPPPEAVRSEPVARSAPPPRAERAPRSDAPARRLETRGGDAAADDTP